MRMRGLEPPPGFPDTDLNRARLPIPPHPRACEQAKIAHLDRRAWEHERARVFACSDAGGRGGSGSERFASLDPVDFAPLSSRGLGRRPLMAETRVRIPVAVFVWPRVYGAFAVLGAARARIRASGADQERTRRRFPATRATSRSRRRFGEQATGARIPYGTRDSGRSAVLGDGPYSDDSGPIRGDLAGLPLPAFTRATRCGGTRSRAAGPPIRCRRSAPIRP